MDQRKKIIIGGVVALLVVGILFFSFRSSSTPQEGILSEEEPKFDVKDLQNMAPQDGSALIAFQGYAKYLSPDYGKKVYLALAPITGISVNAADQEPALPKVTLASAHGKMSMEFSKNKDKDARIRADKISIETSDGDVNKSCEVKTDPIVFKAHFECEKPIIVQCVRTTKDKDGKEVDINVAELTISAARIEVTGNATDHKNGKFTFPVEQCV